MAIRVEYDDGKTKRWKDRLPITVAKGREPGFYAIMEDGTEHRIGISFMKVGEIAAMERLLNAVRDQVEPVTLSSKEVCARCGR